jgi:hypothetical protein
MVSEVAVHTWLNPLILGLQGGKKIMVEGTGGTKLFI